jgi:ATP diphosphatase
VNKKFKKRIAFIESNAQKPLDEMTLQEMDGLWNKAKTMEK